jgi:hypothetical protein
LGSLRLFNSLGELVVGASWYAGENLGFLRAEPGTEPKRCATGGRENPFKLWDISTQQNTFAAKNVCYIQINGIYS